MIQRKAHTVCPGSRICTLDPQNDQIDQIVLDAVYVCEYVRVISNLVTTESRAQMIPMCRTIARADSVK